MPQPRTHHDDHDHHPRLTGDAIDIHFIGNATVLLSYGPLTLTDPNVLHRGQYAYPGHGLLTRRLTEPALDGDELPRLDVDELPRLDAVVLSHLHGDHWDAAPAGTWTTRCRS
ncbi:MBL fold metallo-hydrolase [Streptomyces iakyrus]|uniref:MBL fold metallo-hydrolase n=1 Tax=Streptomyces iakyrus TaxID=68219 RepID=UPI0036C17947